ncbi:MAG: hypothetical protein NZ108_09795, partial [Bacteroidia bacterium]|nr:hypothetical protein [Bacteroidia bacterium]
LLNQLENYPEVIFAQVHNKEGTLVAKYGKLPAEPIIWYNFDSLQTETHILNSVIKDRSRVYGTLRLKISTQSLQSELQNLYYLVSFLILVVFIIGVIVALYLQQRISSPIIRLAGITQAISENADFSIQVHHTSTIEEIARLYDNFNRMLQQINLQNQKIRELNSELEAKVEARVKELQLAKEDAERQTERAESARKEAVELANRLKSKQQTEQQIAKFGEELLTTDTHDIGAWANTTYQLILKHLPAVTGALYLAETNSESFVLRNIREDELPKVLSLGETLVGQVAVSKKIVTIEPETSSSQIQLKLGTGEWQPRAILLIPFLAGDTVQGVGEFLLRERIDDTLLRKAEAFSQSVGNTLAIIRNRDAIQKLLEETQQKNIILQQREEELKSNNQILLNVQQELLHSQEQLQELNENLELLVAKRTEELRKTLEDLQKTQDQLVRSEKLASLGQLV